MSLLDTIRALFGGKKKGKNHKKRDAHPEPSTPEPARVTLRDGTNISTELALQRELMASRQRELELKERLELMEMRIARNVNTPQPTPSQESERAKLEKEQLLAEIKMREQSLHDMKRQLDAMSKELKELKSRSGLPIASIRGLIPMDAGENLPFGSYTFENFITGKNNKFVYTAATAVAEAPADAYNPLFIWGGVGLGKTHLMKAIANYTTLKDRSARVVYTTSESFANELIESVETASLEKFRDKYRKATILLIDDIQFLAGEERTQEEFFHTFNALYDNHRQIVISSDKPPAAIKNLEKRLRSRFEGGLITEIRPPDTNTRIAILQQEAKRRKMKVPRDVIEYIARRVNTNIRALKGALNRVYVYAVSNERNINIAFASEVLNSIMMDTRDNTSELGFPVHMSSTDKTEAPASDTVANEDSHEAKEDAGEGGSVENLEEMARDWRLQGYITTRLDRALENYTVTKNMRELQSVFESYKRDLEKLNVLEARIKGLENEGFDRDVKEIRSKMLNPDRVDEIEDDIKLLEEKVRGKKELMLHQKMEELKKKGERTRQELENLKNLEKRYSSKGGR